MERGRQKISGQDDESGRLTMIRFIELLGVEIENDHVKTKEVLDACREFINADGEHLEEIPEGERGAFRQSISDFRYSYGELD